MRSSADVVVVGAGFAGAATAWQLARRGVHDVVVLEREAVPGVHASGRNAGIARTIAMPPSIEELAREGVAAIESLPSGNGSPLLRRTGLVVLAGFAGGRRLRRQPGRASWLDRAEIEDRIAATRGGAFVGGLYAAADGVVDVAALLHAYLREACASGARLLTSVRVLALQVQGARVVSLETNQGPIAARVVVNAAGPWATELGALAGASSPPLATGRRHLCVTDAAAWVQPAWPVVWDDTNRLYFRPEPPGLLLSGCDHAPYPAGSVPVDPDATVALAAKVRRVMPRLSGLGVGRVWAGLRTSADDGRCVIGRDPMIPNLVWCAGLGDHGMTASAAAGRLAAEAVLGAPAHPDHDPARFLRGRRARREAPAESRSVGER